MTFEDMSDEFDEKLAEEGKHFSIVGVEIGQIFASLMVKGIMLYVQCMCVYTTATHT